MPPVTQLSGKKHNIVYGGDDVKLLGDINEPDCCVYIAALPESKIEVRGNIAAKSVHISGDVVLYGAITAEADIFLDEGVKMSPYDSHPLIAGGNIVLNVSIDTNNASIIAGGDIYLDGAFTVTNKIIAGGNIILPQFSNLVIEDYVLDGVKHEGTYLAGGKIYLGYGRFTEIRIDRLTKKIVTHPYNADTPTVCLKNGVAMTGGAELVPCAPTPIPSSNLEGLRELMLPAPGDDNAVPYTAITGVSPSHKVQAMAYRNACWISRAVQDSSGAYVSKNSFNAYIRSNLDDLISSCSLIAQLEPEKFAEAEVQRKCRKYVLEALYFESGERAISQKALEEATYHVAQVIAGADAEYFIEMDDEKAKEEAEPSRVEEPDEARGSFFKALMGAVRKIF